MCTISRSTCWVITDGLEDVVPEGAAVYGLTRAKGDAMVGSDPHCALMSQAGALEISIVQMIEATALGYNDSKSTVELPLEPCTAGAICAALHPMSF